MLSCVLRLARTLLFLFAIGGLARAQEMATLAQAVELCGVDTGHYVSLETLNDLPTASTSQTPYNGINNEGGTWVLRPSRGYFEPNRVNLVTAFNSWQGPYANYQLQRTQTTSSPYDLGSPLDPWGTPYYFFSPLGLIRGDEGNVTLELYRDRFDRYAIVSLGPDGIMSNDDAVYLFGAGVTSFAISSILDSGGGLATKSRAKAMPPGTPLSGGSFAAHAGDRIIVRGINFGAQAGAEVRWGATPLTQIHRWESREIELTLPASTGTELITVVRGATASRPATLTIDPAPLAATGWALYP